MTIWKFALNPRDEVHLLEMPEGTKILDVQIVGGTITPMLWAFADSTRPMEKRRFHTLATGQTVEKDLGLRLEYVGSYQVQYMAAFHLFEEKVEVGQ